MLKVLSEWLTYIVNPISLSKGLMLISLTTQSRNAHHLVISEKRMDEKNEVRFYENF